METTGKRLGNNLISVIIPCYNQGHYLATAIESALSQEGVQVEVVVVDDGSTDNSKAVAVKYNEVKYVYQDNKGLSNARNTGIDNCGGEFVVFLDADDWLLEDSLLINLQYLQNNEKAVFVSGAYKEYHEATNRFIDRVKVIDDNHYLKLLEINYISMIAAVMFRRCILESFRFDEQLKACEDYDLYLRVSRSFQVLHHTTFISVYRFHQFNMSGKHSVMLEGSLKALYGQKSFLITPSEKKIWTKGINFWKQFYAKEALESLFMSLKRNSQGSRKEEIKFLWKYSKPMYLKYLKAKSWQWVKLLYKKIISLY